jgi:hypothetical protein
MRVSVAMVWVTPYKLFLKVPWVNKQLASSDFIFGTRKKAADAKYGKKLSWEDILTPFIPPIIENSRSDGFLGDGRQKTNFVTTCYAINLC